MHLIVMIKNIWQMKSQLVYMICLIVFLNPFQFSLICMSMIAVPIKFAPIHCIQILWFSIWAQWCVFAIGALSASLTRFLSRFQLIINGKIHKRSTSKIACPVCEISRRTFVFQAHAAYFIVSIDDHLSEMICCLPAIKMKFTCQLI